MRLGFLLGCFVLVAISLPVNAAVDPARTLSMTRDGNTFRLSWPVTDVAVRLEATTNLTTPAWLPVPHVFTNGAFQTTETLAGPARFYRLSTLCNTNARVVPVMVWTRTYENETPSTNVLVPNLPLTPGHAEYFTENNLLPVSNEAEQIFDASLSLHPGTCSTNHLSFRWTIEYPDNTDYIHPGITGVNSPVLRMAIGSFESSNNQRVILHLIITDLTDPNPSTKVVTCDLLIEATGDAYIPPELWP